MTNILRVTSIFLAIFMITQSLEAATPSSNTCQSLTELISELGNDYREIEKEADRVHITAAASRDCKGLNDAHILYYQMWEEFEKFDLIKNDFYKLSCTAIQRDIVNTEYNEGLDRQFSAEIMIHLTVDQKKEFGCVY